ncbi:MAG TPA: GtrA family protein [Hyphomicrobiaceae bacterium]|nr:GtrA family protein [Hyphomicrobiaceae bacterium]
MTRGPGRHPTAHIAGFLASGGLAFTVDAGVLLLATQIGGLDPFIARALGISAAMIAGWLAHRSWTFAVAARPTFKEFLHYAALQAGSIASNYAIYAAILLLRPATEPLVALFVSSAVAAVIAYVGMRLGVFRRAR